MVGCVSEEAGVTDAQGVWWTQTTMPGAWVLIKVKSHQGVPRPFEMLYWQHSGSVSALSKNMNFLLSFNCYDSMLIFAPNVYVDTSILRVMVFEDGACER